MGLITVASYLFELRTGHAWSVAHAPFLKLFLTPPGRMAIITAALFSLFGVVVILLSRGSRRAADISHAIIIPIAAMSYLVLVGHIFNVPALYDWLGLPIALNSDIAFCALCLAALSARPNTWLTSAFSGSEAGSTMARQLLPALLIIPLLIGWLRLYGERSGISNPEVVTAVAAVTYTACLLWLVWLSARSVNRTDGVRRAVEEDLRKSEERLRSAVTDLEIARDELEIRVRERTTELAQTVNTLKSEVEQRTNAEHRLLAASAYARNLLESSLDPLVTISPDGHITDVNRATESATGVEREQLVGTDFSSYFTEPEVARQGYQRVLAEGFVRDYSLSIRHASGRIMDVLYNATVYSDQTGAVQGVFAAARDVTDRKAAESRQHVSNALMELFARKNSRKEYLASAAQVIREWSGCRYVGIRVVDSDERIPYDACLGFDSELQQLEGNLSLIQDACFCTRAITQKLEAPDRLVSTRNGSFRCENTGEFALTLTPETQAMFRGTCIQQGFGSLAIIPIRYREQTLGAIHLADKSVGMVPLERIEFLELISPLIGEAIHRFNAESELEKHRQHLEELVQQRTSDLEQANSQLQQEIVVRKHAEEDLTRSNEDLQQFAYVASHDLQEPLRAVAGFVGMLRKQFKHELNSEASEYIDLAIEGAERMQTLIHDLLSYSRVGTRGAAFAPVQMQAAVDAATGNLRVSIEESNATVTCDPSPTIVADASQITQLLQNLIGNAIKFRGEKPPLIHVSAKREDHQWVFGVCDNGIGMESQYFDRIFLIFQRLHSRNRYPGTGIGLAICKKIVERHGGTIWVQSKPGEGSTFFFSIPDRGDDD